MTMPMTGMKAEDAIKPMEKAPTIVALLQPNSAEIAGNSSEYPVRALTATAMVTKAMATTIQP